MSNTTIALRSSGVASNTPSLGVITEGELSLNYADGILYYKTASNTLGSIRTTQPAGLTTEIQFNDSGSFGSNSGLTFNKSTGTLSAQYLTSTNSQGDEGGEILLAKAVSNTTLVGTGVTIDVYQNKLRIFEQGGTARGVYIDLTAAGAGVGTNLISGTAAVTSVGDQTGAISNTQILSFVQNVSSTNGITFDYVAAANNGYGQNFKVGDDAWIGDYNSANAIKIKGQQDPNQGFIAFGNSTMQLGQANNAALTFGGSANTIWHAGNDGAGSGLDADLLDGQHASYYATDTKAQAAFDKANTQFWTNTSASAGSCPTANYWIKALTFTLPNVGDSTTIKLRTKIKLFANATYSDNDDTDTVWLTYVKTGASTVAGAAYWYPENSESAISNSLSNHTLTYNATTGVFEYYRRSTVIGGHLLVQVNEVIQANSTLQTVEPTIVTNGTWASAVTSLGATATFDDIDVNSFEDLTVSGTLTGSVLTVSSTVTTTGANATVGSSTANSTYNLGSGATVATSSKFVNIGTGGVSGSTTQITLGSVNSSNTTVYGRTEFDLDGTGVPLIGATNPITSFVATSNNYIQTYILNSSNGKYASSDLVAFPVNGSDVSGWIDVGITSNTFNYPTYSVTGANEGYIFMSAPSGSGTSGNLVIATDSTGTSNSIEFYTGGFSKTKTDANVKITTQTTSTSNTTGSMVIRGGLGVTGNIYADAVYDGGVEILAYTQAAFDKANTDATNISATAAVYGNASYVPVVTLTANGRVSAITNTAIAIASNAVSGLATSATTDTTNATNITSGTLGAARLPTVGTAGTYGNTTYIPVITTDSYGRVSAVTNTAIDGSALSGVVGARVAVLDDTASTNTYLLPMVLQSGSPSIVYRNTSGFSFNVATKNSDVGGGLDGTFSAWNINVKSTSTSTSNSTGALKVIGGIGVTGNVYADGVYDGGVKILSLAQAAFNQANTDYTTISATAAVYGNATYIPVTTLAANGRVSSITNTAISFPVTSVAGVTGAVSNTSLLNGILSVDGASSGLDADLLDGQHGSYYATDTKAQAAFDKANTAITTSGGTISGSLVVTGNLSVQGDTTYIDVGTIKVEDKNIELGNVATPTDTTADGGGITLLGSTNKTFQWVNATGYWTSNVGISAPTVISTVATGTAPLTVASTTMVTNLNADYLDGQHGSYYATDTKAQAAFDKANSAATTANTDYTNISVTAGTYGNSTAIPSVTVDANGRVSAITTQTFSAATVGDILALSIALG